MTYKLTELGMATPEFNLLVSLVQGLCNATTAASPIACDNTPQQSSHITQLNTEQVRQNTPQELQEEGQSTAATGHSQQHQRAGT
jgi:hypothetical protein